MSRNRIGDFRLSILRRPVRYRLSLALPRSSSLPPSNVPPYLANVPKRKPTPTPTGHRKYARTHTHTRRAARRGGAGTPPAVPTLLWLLLPPSAATFLFRNPSTEARTAAPPKTGNTFPQKETSHHLSHLRPISSQMVNKMESHCDTCDTFLRSSKRRKINSKKKKNHYQ